MQVSYEKTVGKKNKTSTQTAQVVWTEQRVSTRKKCVKGESIKNTASKVPGKAQKKKKKVLNLNVVNSSNEECALPVINHPHESVNPSNEEFASPVINERHQSVRSKKSKQEERNYNQKRVSKAIQNISNTKSNTSCKNDFLEAHDNDDDHAMSLDVGETNEQSADKEVPTELSDERDFEEKTSYEEDYQRKYFQLLDTMKDLQEKFLISQQNIEQHVAVNDAFMEGMKVALEEKNNELVLAKEELEICKAQNSELENLNVIYERDMETLNRKVEEISMTRKATRDDQANEKERREKELECTINHQNTVLDFYKLLTGVTLEKDPTDDHDGLAVCESFRCSIKPTESEELRFVLSQDREFAEIEYKPLPCGSQEAEQKHSSLPTYLKEQIFFADEQAPKFLLRLLRAVHSKTARH